MRAGVSRSVGVLVLVVMIAKLATIAASIGLFYDRVTGAVLPISVEEAAMKMYGHGIYRYDSLLVGAGFRGVDAVTLFLGVPLLVTSAVLYRRGSFRGALLLAGTLAYFLYNYASMALSAAYNDLFLVYVALFSTSLFAFILVLMSFDLASLPSRFSPALPRGARSRHIWRRLGSFSSCSGSETSRSRTGQGQRACRPRQLHDNRHLRARSWSDCAGRLHRGRPARAVEATRLSAGRDAADDEPDTRRRAAIAGHRDPVRRRPHVPAAGRRHDRIVRGARPRRRAVDVRPPSQRLSASRDRQTSTAPRRVPACVSPWSDPGGSLSPAPA